MSFTRLFVILAIFAVGLTATDLMAEDQLEKDLSAILDADKDGKISDKEAQQGVNKVGKASADKSEDGQRLKKGLDKNNDGRVDRNEVQEAIAKKRADTPAGEGIAAIFRRLDSNNDRVISEAEIGKVIDLISLADPEGAERLDKMFTFMDRNKDRKVSIQEAMLVADFAAQMEGKKAPSEPSREEKVLAHAQKTLQQLDKNSDGELSRREAGKNRNLGKLFRKIDVDESGTLSVDEMVAYLQKLQPAPAAPKEQ